MGTAAFWKRQPNSQPTTSSILPPMTSQVPVNHQQSNNDTLTSSANLPMLPSSPIQQEESNTTSLTNEIPIELTPIEQHDTTDLNVNNKNNDESPSALTDKLISQKPASSTITRTRIPIHVLQKLAENLSKPPTLSAKCPSIILAKQFVDSLKWHDTLFDSANDQCYCKNCYTADLDDVITAGDGRYVIPRGWVRLGLRVDPIFKDEHDIWNRWIVTFHGTTIVAARSILTHRHFYLPGDKLIDGTILGIREGHIPDQKFIFTSPTIAYSSLPVYSPSYDFYSNQNDNYYKAQLVLQCRQQPDTFKVQGETVGAKSIRLCPFIPNNVIEYFTDIRASIVAYGLLVQMNEK